MYESEELSFSDYDEFMAEMQELFEEEDEDKLPEAA